jgi:hypothetical protein
MERIHIHPQQTNKRRRKKNNQDEIQTRQISFFAATEKKQNHHHRIFYKKRKVCLTWKRMFNDNHTTDILNTQYSVYSKSNGLNKAIYVCIYICIYQIDMKESICTVH